MSERKMDMAKVLAMLSQPKEEPAPLTNVEKRIIGVPFLNQKGEKEVWAVASCHPADPARNGKLADDDLVFNNVALPAHTGCDDTVYGSLKVYREEIAEELSAWCAHHGKDALQAVFDEVLDNAKEEEKISLQATFESVKKAISGGL